MPENENPNRPPETPLFRIIDPDRLPPSSPAAPQPWTSDTRPETQTPAQDIHTSYIPPQTSSPSTGSGPAASSPLPAAPAAALSLFPSARSTTPERFLTVEDLVALIRDPVPRVAARLAEARRALADGDTERFAALKRELPAVSIAGTFSARNNKGLLAHSGLVPIDLDHLTPEAMAEAKTWLRENPFCAFLYTSPSGSGLKGAIHIDTRPTDDAGHKAAFAAVRNYLHELYHLELDPACKDVARLAFLSHDPECHHNPHPAALIVANWTDLSPAPLADAASRSRDRKIVGKPTSPLPGANDPSPAAQPWTSDTRPETPPSASRSRDREIVGEPTPPVPGANPSTGSGPTAPSSILSATNWADETPYSAAKTAPVASRPHDPLPQPTIALPRGCSASSGPAAQHSHTSYIPPQTSSPSASSGPAASSPADLRPAEVASGDKWVLFIDNDAGRAARFVDRWRDEIRYITDRALWLVWEGRWKIDRSGGIVRRAIILAYEIYDAASALPAPKREKPKPQAELPDLREPSQTAPQALSLSNGPNGKEDFERQAATLKLAAKWGNRRIIESNVELAAKHPSIQVETAQLDADPWLLGTPNAIVDLRTGCAYSHTPEHLVTLSTRAVFDHTATAPRWERFLEEIYPDPALRRYVWKVLGYSLTGLTGEKCFHFLTGVGNNGKSKLCEAVEYTAGDYAGHAAKGLLAANDKGQYPLREAASIVGKRIIIGPETDARERLNVSVIKSLTGHGDTMRAANLYENQYDFIPVGKLFIMGNHKPTINDTGAAIWNRVRLIPHEVIVPPDQQDKSLGEKLRAEASGILNWLIEGCLLWQREGLEPPDKVRAAVELYRTEEDTLGEFITECIGTQPGNVVPHSILYNRYDNWAQESGIRHPLTKRGLAKTLREKGWRQTSTMETRTAWEGIILL
jgi:P4 family phage/plasmid primase-like protien